MNPETRKNAVVIGGGNGIGKACAHLFAQRGWRVAVVDIDQPAAQSVAGDIGSAAMAFPGDVASFEKLERLAATIEAGLGPVSSLVVSSGAFQPSLPPYSLPLDTWDQVMRVNLDGTYFANRIFGSLMARRGAGSIVNIASITGMGSSPLHAYGTSKAGVIALSQNLAGEWGRAGVRVNAVSPGVTLVDRLLKHRADGTRYYGGDFGAHAAMGRSVEPHEVAETVEFLASDRASAVTGINLLVDCGWAAASLWEMFGGMRPADAVT